MVEGGFDASPHGHVYSIVRIFVLGWGDVGQGNEFLPNSLLKLFKIEDGVAFGYRSRNGGTLTCMLGTAVVSNERQSSGWFVLQSCFAAT